MRVRAHIAAAHPPFALVLVTQFDAVAPLRTGLRETEIDLAATARFEVLEAFEAIDEIARETQHGVLLGRRIGRTLRRADAGISGEQAKPDGGA